MQGEDLYLLCSDGLSDMLDDAGIAQVLLARSSLEACSQALIAAANAAGGRDNVSVVLARCGGNGGAASKSWWPFKR